VKVAKVHKDATAMKRLTPIIGKRYLAKAVTSAKTQPEVVPNQPRTKTKMYKVEVDMKWRDHIDHSKIQNKIKTFTGRDKADVYSYIKYYTLAFGICDVILIEEGEINEA
jgi:hypothetical protein